MLWFFVLLWSSCFASESIDNSRFQKAKNNVYESLEFPQENTWKGPFFFIQMADCQLGFFEKNRSWTKEIALLERAVEQINRLNPRFVIVCGDLAHAWPHKPFVRQQQVDDYKRIMSKVNSHIPLVCVCGNHDVGNIPNRATIQKYESDFGSHYFCFWVGGTQCLALNSSLLWNPKDVPDIYAEQYSWLKKQLKLNFKPVHRFVFMHHPWFVNSIDDADSYEVIPKICRRDCLDLLNDAGVTASFSGHLHYNNIHHYGTMELITTGALGMPLRDDPSGLRIVEVYRDRIEHSYYDIYAVPETVELQKQ